MFEGDRQRLKEYGRNFWNARKSVLSMFYFLLCMI